jgi:flavin reductase (DIM6/NTAB) family NADH-FMN oxidoreductase RutF
MYNAVSHFQSDEIEFSEKLRKGLRSSAISVSLLTTRDLQGTYHGLAVTGAVPLSTSLPSMIVAINRSASSYPAIQESNLYCINQITSKDMEILDYFCRSDMRDRRFQSCSWRSGLHGLPYLETATTSFFCRVRGTHDYGDHTVFVGRIEGVSLGDQVDPEKVDPIIWINGAPARLTERRE